LMLQLPEATAKIALGGGGGFEQLIDISAKGGVARRLILVTKTVKGPVKACVYDWPFASSASRSENENEVPGGRDWTVTSFWPSRVPPLERSSRLKPT